MYSEFEGSEIMFHVSTLLPYTPNNRYSLSSRIKVRVYLKVAAVGILTL